MTLLLAFITTLLPMNLLNKKLSTVIKPNTGSIFFATLVLEDYLPDTNKYISTVYSKKYVFILLYDHNRSIPFISHVSMLLCISSFDAS